MKLLFTKLPAAKMATDTQEIATRLVVKETTTPVGANEVCWSILIETKTTTTPAPYTPEPTEEEPNPVEVVPEPYTETENEPIMDLILDKALTNQEVWDICFKSFNDYVANKPTDTETEEVEM